MSERSPRRPRRDVFTDIEAGSAITTEKYPMNASMPSGPCQMETRFDCVQYRRVPPARRVRRFLSRVGTLAIVLVITTVIVFGQRWVLEKGPASVIELGLAARASEATHGN